jgi:hypothetical protein
MCFRTAMLFIFVFISPVLADDEAMKPVRIGVLENQYDHIETLLTKYRIPHTMVKYRDLEKQSLYSSYDVLFFPCGAEPALTSSVNILSRGVHIEGVTLNEQYYKVDSEKTGNFIKNFINNGGSAYFSDFSFRYLQDSLNSFSFYKNYPYIGNRGSFKAIPKNDLVVYIAQPTIQLNVTHSGWVIPAEVNDAKSLLIADCDTPLGMKTSPIISLIRKENGQAIYTSYHESSDTDGLMRFLIMRTIYMRDTRLLEEYISRWEQKIRSIIADRSLPGETARQYRMQAKKDRNNFYFRSDGGEWQVDIFDEDGSFLFSSDRVYNDFMSDFKLSSERTLTVKIIPLSPEKYHTYVAATASGFRIFPYFMHIIFGTLALIIIILYLRYLRIGRFRGKTFTGGKI